MNHQEKAIAQQAAFLLLLTLALGALLVLDLLNQGLVWRSVQRFRSPNNASLPGEARTIGGAAHRTDVTFLS